LFREHGVSLQVCGADQWGNCIAGVELIRRIDNAEANVWSAPLVVNKATGVKFGKSEDGAVWLDESKTSVYRFYQFWLNTDDESVGDFLKLYTMLDRSAISQLMTEFEQNRGGRLAQKTLAYEVTKLVHGVDKANAVVKATEVLFGGGDFRALGELDLRVLRAELPVVEANKDDKLGSIFVRAGLAASVSEANRLAQANALAVNGEPAADMNNALTAPGPNLLRRGKNQFALADRKD
jgi:tyrosyl-tRNA synthetase